MKVVREGFIAIGVVVILQLWQVISFMPVRFSRRITQGPMDTVTVISSPGGRGEGGGGVSTSSSSSMTRLSLFEGLKNLVGSKDSTAQLTEVHTCTHVYTYMYKE